MRLTPFARPLSPSCKRTLYETTAGLVAAPSTATAGVPLSPSIHGMQPHSFPHLRWQGARAEWVGGMTAPAAGDAHSSQFGFTRKEVFQAVQRHVQPVVHSQFAEQLIKVDLHGAFGLPQPTRYF